MTRFWENGQNDRFWAKMGYFWQILPQNGENKIFWENPKMSPPYAYYAATLCKKLEQSYERILRFKMYGRTEVNINVPTASDGWPKIEKGYYIFFLIAII